MWQKYKYQVYLLIVALLCYWPLAFFQSTLLCDDIDVALPTKYFAGECYQNGILPLWNPYQVWGFPAHADLQYTNWNPEVIITGLLHGYDYNTLHVLFLGYLFLAGLGMFLLAKYLSRDERVAFFIGAVYMLSGVVTGHVQSLVTILGLVWIPYVILHFLKLLDKPGLRQAALLCIFSYLLMSLGYQAFAFMLLPVFVSILVWKLVVAYKQKDRVYIRRVCVWSMASLVFMVLLLLPVLITQIQSKPFVSRLNGMPLNEVLSNPFPPRAMVSLLNPLFTIGHDDAFNTDTTMRNLFFGIIPLGLLVLSFFKKQKTTLDWILLIVSLVYLLGSFGEVLPVRAWMYHVLPGFKLFRFPSLLRIIVLICSLCYLSLNLRETLITLFEKQNRKHLFFLAGISVLVTLALYAYVNIEQFTFLQSADMFSHRITRTSPYELGFYMACIQCIILLIAYLSWLKSHLISRASRVLFIAAGMELALMITVYGQFTAFTDLRPAHFQDNFSKLSKSFPFPSKDAVMDNNDKFNYIHGFWRNTGCFKKQLSLGDEWTSYYFTNFDFIVNRMSWIRDTLQTYPFVYVSKPHANEVKIILPIDTTATFIQATLHQQNAEADIQYLEYDPNHIVFTSSSKEPVTLNIQQSYFTGWHATVDGVPVDLLWNAGLLMSLPLEKGKHKVELHFENKAFVFFLVLSYVILVLLLVCIIVLTEMTAMRKYVYVLDLLVIVGLCVFLFIKNIGRSDEKPSQKFSIAGQPLYAIDAQNKAGLRDLLEGFPLHHPAHQAEMDYTWHDAYNSPELWHAIGCDPKEKKEEMSGKISYMPQWPEPLFREDFSKVRSEFIVKIANQHLDTTYEFVLFKQNPYTPAREIAVEAALGKDLAGTLMAYGARRANPLVVCNIKHDDGSEENLYFPMNKYMIYGGYVQKIPYYFATKDKIKAGDTVKLFVMSDQEAQVLITDWSCTAI